MSYFIDVATVATSTSVKSQEIITLTNITIVKKAKCALFESKRKNTTRNFIIIKSSPITPPCCTHYIHDFNGFYFDFRDANQPIANHGQTGVGPV